ncbi:unnamed protein product [Urochloa humidicola]
MLCGLFLSIHAMTTTDLARSLAARCQEELPWPAARGTAELGSPGQRRGPENSSPGRRRSPRRSSACSASNCTREGPIRLSWKGRDEREGIEAARVEAAIAAKARAAMELLDSFSRVAGGASRKRRVGLYIPFKAKT